MNFAFILGVSIACATFVTATGLITVVLGVSPWWGHLVVGLCALYALHRSRAA